MTKPIELDAFRPHLVGTALCVACSYMCVSVLPEVNGKKFDLECPRCKEMKMAFLGIQAEDKENV